MTLIMNIMCETFKKKDLISCATESCSHKCRVRFPLQEYCSFPDSARLYCPTQIFMRKFHFF